MANSTTQDRVNDEAQKKPNRDVRRWTDGIIAVGVLSILALSFTNMNELNDIQVQQMRIESRFNSWQDRLIDPNATLPGAVSKAQYKSDMAQIRTTLERIERKLESLDKNER